MIPQTFDEGKWSDKKRAALLAAKKLFSAAERSNDKKVRDAVLRRAVRMAACSRNIIVSIDDAGALRVSKALLCKDRLCPVCCWRLAAQRTYELQRCIDYLLSLETGDPDIRGILLTLTVRNCSRDTLGMTISHLCKSFTRLKKHRLFARSILGYARSVEVTYSRKRDDFHPHIHALLLVPSTYDAHTITQEQFCEMWQTAARLDYKPIVDVRFAYSSRKGAEDEPGIDAAVINDTLAALRSAAVEAGKYAVKPGVQDAIINDPHAAEIAMQLSGHRLVSYGGSIKAARAALGFTSDDPDELHDDIPLDNPGPTVIHEVAYTWSSYTASWVYVDEVTGNPLLADKLLGRRNNG